MTADESPRLYSRPSIVPVDTVAPQHQLIHADLEAWGRWNHDRRQKLRCGSAEKKFDSNWRTWHYPSAQEMMPRGIPNQRVRMVDRAVLRMPEQHRETIRRYYTFGQRPETICGHVCIRFQDFGRWMFDCRSMVINILRALDA